MITFSSSIVFQLNSGIKNLYVLHKPMINYFCKLTTANVKFIREINVM